MSKKDDLRKMNKEAREAIDKTLKDSGEIAGKVPHLYEKKMELEADDKILERVPNDWIDEMWPTLHRPIERDREVYIKLAQTSEDVVSVLKESLPTTDSTSITLLSVTTMGARGPGEIVLIDPPAHTYYQEVVEHKVRRQELPKKLDALHEGLGVMFTVVHDSVDQAKYDVMTAGQAIESMRNVLVHIWGSISQRADDAYPEKWKQKSHKFSSEARHVLVAECLIKDEDARSEFAVLLTTAYNLYHEMSKTDVGKDPSNKNQDLLQDLYVRWVQVISAIVGMLGL
jgi:hypothetical protein